MFLFKVIFSDKVSVHTNELEADIGMPMAGVMHQLSFAQQSSRYQVPWPPVEQRTATAGNYRSPLWEAWVCLETGFRLGPFLEILGLQHLTTFSSHEWFPHPFLIMFLRTDGKAEKSSLVRYLHIKSANISSAKEDTSTFTTSTWRRSTVLLMVQKSQDQPPWDGAKNPCK